MKVQLRDNLQGLIPILREKLKLAFRMEFPQDKLDKGDSGFYKHMSTVLLTKDFCRMDKVFAAPSLPAHGRKDE